MKPAFKDEWVEKIQQEAGNVVKMRFIVGRIIKGTDRYIPVKYGSLERDLSDKNFRNWLQAAQRTYEEILEQDTTTESIFAYQLLDEEPECNEDGEIIDPGPVVGKMILDYDGVIPLPGLKPLPEHSHMKPLAVRWKTV